MRIILLSLLTITVGCVTVTSLSVSNFEGGGTPVETVDYYVDLFHLTSPTFNLNAKLKETCQSGNINGVQTALTMREFVFLQFYEAEAKGYCKK